MNDEKYEEINFKINYGVHADGWTRISVSLNYS